MTHRLKRERVDQRALTRTCQRCARFTRQPGELTLKLITTTIGGVVHFSHRWLCRRCAAE